MNWNRDVTQGEKQNNQLEEREAEVNIVKSKNETHLERRTWQGTLSSSFVHVIGDIINSYYNLHGRGQDAHDKTI